MLISNELHKRVIGSGAKRDENLSQSVQANTEHRFLDCVFFEKLARNNKAAG